MRNLKNVISEYLIKPTDFAVQIVGGWGFGKTFYYRNTLEELICSKRSHNNGTKTYKPIYISLFGLKSIEDIATKIVLEFYQSKLFKDYYKSRVGKKRLKITQSILRIGLRGFLNFYKLGDSKEYLTDIKKIGENVLDSNEIVICFDDLERKDSALNIEDLTGYINSLVDEGIKVILISNEDLLLKNEEEYKNLKEKIIGITVEFVPDTKMTLSSIIKLRYAGFPSYNSFLLENLEILEKISIACKNNFRHITYALDALHTCYSILKKNILDSKHEISQTLNVELPNISLYTLALAAEYKASNLKYNNIEVYKNSFKSLHEIVFAPDNGKSAIIENKTDLDKFLEKYEMPIRDYHFFESIYNYVTGYQEFDSSQFAFEFIENYSLEKGQILPQYELLHSLNYDVCFNLTDDEYKERTLLLIEYANDGQFNAAEYLTVMHYAERLDNVLGLNLEEIRDKLIIGLKKSIKKANSDNRISFTQFEMTGGSDSISEDNKIIYKAGMNEIRQVRTNIKNKEIEGLSQLLVTNFPEFEQKYHQDANFRSELEYNPFLNYISSKKLFEFISTAKNEVLRFLKYFIHSRYKNTELLQREYPNLKQLTILMQTYNDEQQQLPGQGIRKFLIKELTEILIENELAGKEFSVE